MAGEERVTGIVGNVAVSDVVGGGCRTFVDAILDEPLSEADFERLSRTRAATVQGFERRANLTNLKAGATKIELFFDNYPPGAFKVAGMQESAERALDGKRFSA